MVQATWLDLIRAGAVALAAAGGAAGGAVGGASGALAQPLDRSAPLLRDGPLTTLLQPQKLDSSRPLLRPDTGSAATPTKRDTPCTRAGGSANGASGASKVDPTPSLYGGGSGPGNYGRYLPGAGAPAGAASTSPDRRGSPTPAGAAPPPRAVGTDRPLYGGTDRPLWDTGERRPSTGQPTGQQNGKPGQAAGADPAAANTAAAPPAAAPRDRPLWPDGSPMASADPGTAAGIVPPPCLDPATQLSR